MPRRTPSTPIRPRRSTRHRLAASAVLAALVVAGTACSPVQSTDNQAGGGASDTAATAKDVFGDPADPAKVNHGGTLTVALSADPDKLDPSLSRSLYSRYVFHTMCEKLYDLGPDAKIVPQLATALPTIAADGLSLTIPLREGVKFADGTTMDSTAVKLSIERGLTLAGSGRKSELGPISSVQTPDAKTVVIKLSKPFAPLTAALADRAGMVLSPAAVAKLGANFSTGPVCVGPFKFANRVAQNSIKVVRDPLYYAADKVHLDAIEYRIITDSSIRSANLRSGDAQVADSLSTQDAPEVQKVSGMTVLQSESLGYQGLTVNIGNADGIEKPSKQLDTPIAKDPRVRQALALSIDREALVKSIFNGLNTVACSPVSPKSPFSSDAAQVCPAHDPAKAKELLSQAGVSTPYKVSMITSNNPDSLRLAQALQAMVKEGGFELMIKPVEYTSLLDQQDRGDFELLQLGWSGRVDPDANIFSFVGTGGSQNVAGYSDPELDKLLTDARQSQDQAKRVELYGQVVAKLQQADPIIYMYRQRNLTGVSNKVLGVQTYPDGVLRTAFAGLAK
ncbi:peptide/nickel transport system substrate-binding protein [Kribbella sp. VKM Ac-2527]|uniref:Peptide/nickel transport system substrate-binding protein n=1 Tax=Kribbella caucasensis TaxID=2512215 RepID=A0A4R6KB53_9ACTN|nr:ABC transporter substrate-binding protein [Kribbella sp. VKM Ac-2527]TDO45433.1 peptide/nickel transport system substrate-binding protein [Kribbella sp. VKM Ac-2527]